MGKTIKYKRGFVLGKFMPLHVGHMAMIEFGKSIVDELTVLVCTLEREPILGELRYKWVRETYPDLNIVHIKDDVPSYPNEHPDFWDYWMDIFSRYLPKEIEVFVCGEEYGYEVAKRLGIESVIFLRDNKISATKIRTNPLLHWNNISKAAQPNFVQKIAIVGPESTGKTTLSGQLASYFNTNWVAEYGREHFDQKSGRLTLEDISIIGLTQISKEQEAIFHSNKILFCDTDLIVTQIWSEIYFSECPQWILEYNKNQNYTLHLLLDIDIPWVDDGTREFPNLRSFHYERLKEVLNILGFPYMVISGAGALRFENAIKAIRNFIEI